MINDPKILEFLKMDAERCNMSAEELDECYKYEAAQQNISVEQCIANEMEAHEWLKKNSLTNEELLKIVERCNPDNRLFGGDEENPYLS